MGAGAGKTYAFEMIVTLTTTKQADEEINEAADHFTSIDFKLVKKLVLELDDAFDTIKSFLFTFVERLPGLRWKTLKRFPYKLVYKFDLD